MRSQTRNSLLRLAKTASNFSEGIDVTYVAPDASWIALKALRWTDESRGAEGIQIFSGGVEDQEEHIFRFERAALAEAGIDRFEPSGWFYILGERWDFSGGSQMAFNIGPSAENNSIVFVVLRKAVESENTACGDTFDFDLSE